MQISINLVEFDSTIIFEPWHIWTVQINLNGYNLIYKRMGVNISFCGSHEPLAQWRRLPSSV
jgi:hypothetical protein